MQIQITFAYTLTKQAIKTHVPSLKFRSPKPKLNLLQPSTLSPLSSNLILAILKSKIGFLEMNLEVDTKPSLLSSSDKLFTHTLTDAAKHHHQRRRRCSSSSSSSADAKPRDAPTRLNRAQSISHAAAETYLVTRLSFILLRYLGYSSLFIYIFAFIWFMCVFLYKFHIFCLVAEKIEPERKKKKKKEKRKKKEDIWNLSY